MQKIKENKPVILIGYSGHGFVAADIFLTAGIKVVAYCDQEEKLLNPYQLNYLGNENVAFNEGQFTGHNMDDRIDNGRILAQVRVPIKHGISMFELIQQTKSAGGDLICKVIQSLMKTIAIQKNTTLYLKGKRKHGFESMMKKV